MLDFLKGLIDSPAGQAVENALNISPELRAGIEKGLDNAIADLGLIQAVSDATTLEAKLKVVADWIATHPSIIHNAIIRQIGTIIARELQPAGTNLADNQIDAIMQMLYSIGKHESTQPAAAAPPAQSGADTNVSAAADTPAAGTEDTNVSPGAEKPAETADQPKEETPAPGPKMLIVHDGSSSKQLNPVDEGTDLANAIATRFQTYAHLPTPEFGPGTYTFKMTDSTGKVVQEQEMTIPTPTTPAE